MSAEDAEAPAPGPVVAIDGPAASGKSTVAARVAEALGVPHLDTGATYRAVTLACLRAGVDLTDPEACAEVARSVELDRRGGRLLLDGEDVEDEIRGEAVTRAVSAVAAHPPVREAVTPRQRELARERGAVVEGRDIGTVLLPDADLKVYLTASVSERARRRAAQTGVADPGRLEKEIRRRDREDTGREVAPLSRAPDAWELDTTGMTVDEVVEAVVTRAEGAQRTDPVEARRRLPRVAVVGRANVGKSTLVNRILGRRVAIVEQRPGVTRDRTEHVARWRGRPFLLVDTGGWEHDADGLTERVVAQAERAVDEADLVVFVVDVTAGVLPDDERYAELLRRAGTPLLLVANKADAPRHELLAADLYRLGLGEPHPVSALHGRGTGDLLDTILERLPAPAVGAPDETAAPRVAIVGRPNVGKSSLFNRLVRDDRSVVDEAPLTTRDAVDTAVMLDGEPWILVDTAGMRRRYRHGEDTELYSVDRTRAAVEHADLALFVVDGSRRLGQQDQRLAALLRDAGRGLVLVVNKWDLVDEDRRGELERELDRLLRFVTWVPRLNVSARTGRGVRRIAPTLRGVWSGYTHRIPTRELNEVVAELTERSPPPSSRGRPVRVKYATQVDTRPPTVVVFTNRPLQDDYRRYLVRGLRDRFDLLGVPIRLVDRRSGRER